MIKAKIAIVGRVNAGKSTLLNDLTQQNLAITSPQRGTTTDPVRRGYELLGYGAVTFIDTAGLDDFGSELSEIRVEKSRAAIFESDLVLFVTASIELDCFEQEVLQGLDMPTIVVRRGYDRAILLEEIASVLRREVKPYPPFYGELLNSGETVVLVCPIDSEAPEGRLILPQVQALRAALDMHCTAVVVQVEELEGALLRYSPELVVTDSQAFDLVAPLAKISGVALTSFSMLLAAQKGDMAAYREGLEAVDRLQSGDRVLIIEHCSHGVSCDDIGRVKIPRLLRARCGVELEFVVVSGRDMLPSDLGSYALAVQCGGCMVERKPIVRRIEQCRRAGVSVTNYGMLLKMLLSSDLS